MRMHEVQAIAAHFSQVRPGGMFDVYWPCDDPRCALALDVQGHRVCKTFTFIRNSGPPPIHSEDTAGQWCAWTLHSEGLYLVATTDRKSADVLARLLLDVEPRPNASAHVGNLVPATYPESVRYTLR